MGCTPFSWIGFGCEVIGLLLIALDVEWSHSDALRRPSLAVKLGELDAFALQACDGRVEVVAHQVKLMVSTLIGRVGRKLCGRKGENKPTSARIDRVESECVAEERTSTLGVVTRS